jgi:hypothetical protein
LGNCHADHRPTGWWWKRPRGPIVIHSSGWGTGRADGDGISTRASTRLSHGLLDHGYHRSLALAIFSGLAAGQDDQDIKRNVCNGGPPCLKCAPQKIGDMADWFTHVDLHDDESSGR